MKILIVDEYYPPVLDELYRAHPDLGELTHAEQWRIVMDLCHGTADYYSRHLRALGHEAVETVINCAPLQFAWAREHGVPLPRRWRWRRVKGLPLPWPEPDPTWQDALLAAQIRDYRPDVLYSVVPQLGKNFLRSVRPYIRAAVCQIACPYPQGYHFDEYDLMLSSFPHYVERFRAEGLKSEFFRLGFDPSVLFRLHRGPTHDVVFVGSLSHAHTERIDWLARVAEKHPVDFWGVGLDNTSLRGVEGIRNHGPAWGMAMYNVLHNARIALNRHGDYRVNTANNMRLFEATGVGTLLLTDAKENLGEYFVTGREVEDYATAEECIEKIEYFLAHEEKRSAIAAAGQVRTLSDHTYARRMEELTGLLQPLLD